jgi:small subunit ribosomal protein S24e
MPQEFDIQILSEKENQFFNRKDVAFDLTHPATGTPNRVEVKKKLAALKAVDENLVFIKSMRSRMGKHEIKGEATIYKDEKSAQIEPRYIRIRNMPKDQRVEAKKAVEEERKKKKAKAIG